MVKEGLIDVFGELPLVVDVAPLTVKVDLDPTEVLGDVYLIVDGWKGEGGAV